MATLLSSTSTAMAAWPKSLRHLQTCSPGCGSGMDLAVDGMAVPPDSDILSGQFEDVQDYDELLGQMERVSTALTEAALGLEPFAVHLGKACMQHGCMQESKTQQLVLQLNGLALSLKEAVPKLEGVRQLIQQSKFHCARARCEFTLRERTRAKKLLCDEQVADLTRRDRAGARQSFSRNEKQARLLARDAACKEFACCTERAERLAGAVLGRKSTAVEAMLTGLCHFIAAFSVGANAPCQELGDTSDATQHHQQPWRIVVAECQAWPTPTTTRLLPTMPPTTLPLLTTATPYTTPHTPCSTPVCDFGFGLLAVLSSWGCYTGCCHCHWQHNGTAREEDTLWQRQLHNPQSAKRSKADVFHCC